MNNLLDLISKSSIIQGCFMSSVDLHTHCPNQSLLSEYIAVVVAPTDIKLKYGVCRLEGEEGLTEVQRFVEGG